MQKKANPRRLCVRLIQTLSSDVPALFGSTASPSTNTNIGSPCWQRSMKTVIAIMQLTRARCSHPCAAVTSVAEDELLARLEWLKQLHAEDGVPLNHARASIGGEKDSDELERRFARLQQMQDWERSVPSPEFEPEPELDLEPEPESQSLAQLTQISVQEQSIPHACFGNGSDSTPRSELSQQRQLAVIDVTVIDAM